MLNAQIRTSFMFVQVALSNIAAVKISFGRIKVFISPSFIKLSNLEFISIARDLLQHIFFVHTLFFTLLYFRSNKCGCSMYNPSNNQLSFR